MKSKTIKLGILGTMCLTLLVSSVAMGSESTSELDSIIQKGTLVVGVTDFAPMDYKDDDGNWIGFDADLAVMFAESLSEDLEVEFQEIDWDNKILELNSGTIDCVWNGMTLTDEVADSMECSDAYAINGQVVVMSVDSLSEYADVDDLGDLSIAVEAGSAGESVAEENGLNYNSVQSQASALMEVAAGTSDACIIDMTMAEAMTGEGTSYENLGYEIVLSEELYVVGFRKDSGMAAILNEFLEEKIQDGTLDELNEKYDNTLTIASSSEDDTEAETDDAGEESAEEIEE